MVEQGEIRLSGVFSFNKIDGAITKIIIIKISNKKTTKIAIIIIIKINKKNICQKTF